MPEVCTVFSNEGKTRIVAYEGYPRVKIEFFEEKWEKSKNRRQMLCKLVLEDNEIQIVEYSVWELLRRLGHVLLALTEDVSQ